MTREEMLTIEIEVVRTIAFADGDTIEEKIYNALDVLKSRLKQEQRKTK